MTILSNDGSGGFTPTTIDAVSQGTVQVEAGDIDGDGDMDIAAAFWFTSEIVWYENLGGGTWGKATVGTAPGATSVDLADVDSDGNLDIVSTHRNTSEIVWYENNGGTPATFTSHSLPLLEAFDIEAVDLDGDGDVDFGYVGLQGEVGWYENDGAIAPSFTDHLLGIYGAPRQISSADLDGDGLAELMVSLEDDNTFLVLENEGGGQFAETRFATGSTPSSIQAADLDGDSDLDVFTSDRGTSDVIVHENYGGGGFAIATTNEDTSVAVGGISIGDLDAGGSPLEVTIGVTNGSIDLAGVSGLTFSNGDGTDDTAMTFTGSLVNINAAIATITYNPDQDFVGQGQFQVVVDDLGNTGSGGPLSVARTFVVDVLPINDAPTINGLDANQSYIDGGPPVPIDTNVTITDQELSAFDNFGGATLYIGRTGGANPEDIFSATGLLGTLVEGGNLFYNSTVVGSVNLNSGGELVLEFNSLATNTVVNSIAQSIAYSNSSATPPANVDLLWNFNDVNSSGLQGSGGAQFTSAQILVTIDTNTAPLLDNSAGMSLTPLVEGQTNPSGDSVANIIASAGGDRITDVDPGAVEGIAVIIVDNVDGDWQYSLDGGSNWLSFGVVGGSSATLLDTTAMVRFVPDVDYTGSTFFSFRAWDQSDGNISGQSGIDIASTGGTSAFSLDTQSATINISPVNDAPILDTTGNLTLTNVAQDDSNPSGDTIAAIVASDGGDRITDVDTGAVEGIALTFVETTFGFWEYKANSATAWTAVPTVSDSNALLLAPDSELRFVPNSGYNGTSTLSFRAWDQTSGSVGLLRDASLNGGSTAFSVASEGASVTVAPNSAPVLDLDLDNSSGAPGNQNFTSFSTGNGPVNIADTDATLTDIDSPTLSSLTVVLVNPLDGSLEVLSANAGGNPNLSVNYSTSTGILSIVGTDTVATYEQVLRTITYENTSSSPDTTTRTLNVVASDGANNSLIAQSLVSIVSDITAPSVVTNTGNSVLEGNADVIQATELNFSDDIHPTSSLTYTITNAPTNGFVALLSNPNTPITTFSQTQIDAGNLVYVHDDSETTFDSFSFVVDDGVGNSTTTQSFSISVTPVNDAPVGVDDNYTVNEGASIGRSAAIGLLSNDSDAEGDAIFASLLTQATNGTATLAADGSFVYIHDGSETTSDSFTYTTSDANGATSTATVNILIAPVNDAPILAIDDATLNFTEQSPIGVDVSAVVTDIDSPNLSSATIQISANYEAGFDQIVFTDTSNISGIWDSVTGTLTLSGTDTVANYQTALQTLQFQNASDNPSSATRTVTLSVTDEGGLVSASDARDIAIFQTNDAPVAVSDTYNTPEDTALVIPATGVLSNDTDLDGDALTVASVVNAATNGNVSMNADGSFTYTPNLNFTGSDSFAYEITDGNGGTAQAIVNITVGGINDPPAAVNDAFTTNEDTSYTATLGVSDLLLNDSDLDGDTLSVNTTPVTGPGNGTLTLNTNGTFTYTPNNNFNGVDSFVYEVFDGNGGTAQATVAITVIAQNDAPIAVNNGLSLSEDAEITTLLSNLLLNDSDPDGDVLTVSPIPVTAPTNGILTFNGDGTYTYTPNADFNGSDSFVYEISDGNGGVAQATVGISVTPKNDAPFATNDMFSTNEDTPYSAILGVNDLLLNDTDVDGDLLAVNATPVIGPANGVVTINTDGTFTYTPNTGFTGTDSFVYDASDGNGGTAQATVSITVAGTDEPPVAVNDAFTTNEDSPFTTTLGVNDLLLNDLLLNDAGGTLSVNPSPIAAPTNGSLVLNSDGTFTYVPDQDFNGLDSFIYEVMDTNGGTAQATVNITVTAVNDSPLANNESYNVDEGETLSTSLGVLLNDSDVDGDPLTAAIISGPTNGSLTLNPDGSFSYSHDGSETTGDSFTYQVDDPSGATSIATATIAIAPVNDAPTASSPGTVVTNQNTPIALSTINGTAFSVGDIDAQGNPIIVTLSTSNGTLSLASTGGLTFAVGNGSNSSTLTFIGTIDDIQNALDGLQFSPDESFVGNTNISLTVDDQGNFGSGGAKNANAQVLIQVTANESPVSQSDTFSAPIGTAQDGNVLANDTDPDSPNLTATLVEAPTNGTLGLLPDGSFSYLPNPGFVGTDSFTYMASDGFSMSDVATVEINVTPIGNTTPETTSSTTDNSDDSAGNDPPTLTDTTTDQEDDANEIVVPNETVATLATTNPIDSIPTQIVQRVTQTEPEDNSTKLPILVSRVPLDAGPSIIDTIVARSLEGSFDRSEVTVDSNISFDSFPDLLAVSSLRPSAWLWTKMSDVSEQLNERQ